MTINKEITTEHYKELIGIFGRKNIRYDVESPFDFIHIANKGVHAVVFKNFRSHFDVSRDVLAEMLNVSTPTLYRWIKSNKKLERNYSIKLFEIADLFLYGIEIFENKENFFKWLKLPNTALGGLTPQTLIELPDGVSKVRDVLGRIEHGVYS